MFKKAMLATLIVAMLAVQSMALSISIPVELGWGVGGGYPNLGVRLGITEKVAIEPAIGFSVGDGYDEYRDAFWLSISGLFDVVKTGEIQHYIDATIDFQFVDNFQFGLTPSWGLECAINQTIGVFGEFGIRFTFADNYFNTASVSSGVGLIFYIK